MSFTKSAVRGTLWTLLENTSTQLSSFVLFLVFARLIDPKAIGVVQVAITLYSFLTIFVEHGFTTTIIRNKTIEPTTLDTAFWLSVGGGTLIAVALSLFAPHIAAAYSLPELENVLYVVAWCLPITTLGVIQSAVLTRELAFRTQAVRRLIAVLCGGVLGVTLACFGFGVWALVIRFTAETIVYSVMAWVWTPWSPGRRVSREAAREFSSFAVRVAGAFLVSFFNRRIDDLVVGLVLGPVVLGYFAVATRGVLLVTEVALRAAQRTAMPIFSRLQDEPEKLRDAYYGALELGVALASPVFVGMAAVAGELCLTLFGTRWEPVIPAMRVLGYSGIAIAVSAFSGPILIATGRPAWLFYLSVVEAALSVSTSIGSARFGLLAVAWAYVARNYLLIPIALVMVRRALHIDVARALSRMFGPAAASVAMVLVVSTLRALIADWPPALRLCVLAPAGALTYGIFMALAARSTVEKLVSLRRAVKTNDDAVAAPELG